MSKLIRHPKDFWSGVMFIVVGLAFVWFARDYPMGTSTRMGPAYFPTILGYLLAAIGFIVLIRGLITQGEGFGGFGWKGFILIPGAIVIFGLLLRPAGLVIALPVLILVGARASQKFSWRASILLAVGLTVFSYFVFIRGLGLPMPILFGIGG
ncbi:MAG: hypothetical protein AMXMBFR6_10730 [Betaproteobacteria bacterium]